MRQKSSRRFRLSLLAVVFLSAALIVLSGFEYYSDLDLVLADFMFDPATNTFPWRRAWITATLGHDLLKMGMYVLAVIPILACICDLVRPAASWSDWFRTRLRVVALSAVAVPLSVTYLKTMSATYCPWSLKRYGGAAPYVRLFESALESWTSGRCFPAGHASGALWLISIAIFWWPHRPRIAALVGFAMLMIGFGVGWIQQMRGAHFLSHTLWSMWIACAIVLGLFVLLTRHGRAHRQEWNMAKSGKEYGELP